mgnify:CR=1 FL=1
MKRMVFAALVALSAALLTGCSKDAANPVAPVLGESSVRDTDLFSKERARAEAGPATAGTYGIGVSRILFVHASPDAPAVDINLGIQPVARDLVFGNNTTKVDRSRGQRLLEDAMTYALQTDVHRVRCEAAIGIANTRHATGDYEGALRYAMDAMMVACRYGMELRKISLRALVAKIMAERGDPITARHLAKTCIKMATRQRYENAIDGAEKVLLSLPRMSKAITGTDLSGQRRY